ncbi:FABP family protein [Gordonia sp. X0973]|uniref:FABP family protein n=1 Tax=Gordonia sp. X0973 TaxID=2742602 RepID=UPI000F5320E1|nr:FABP family protein [Gordonia sp. X0973]QKT06323.1 FABP family protein [Gordonia sp. X0973]
MTRSGNEAIDQAASIAETTGSRNLPSWGDLPLPADTANLRDGADLHSGLLALLPMVGVWRGEGVAHGLGDDGADLAFAEQIIVSHDGQNFLNWQSRSWSVDNRGGFVAPLFRESGFWRISEDDSIELVLAHAEGAVELFYGKPLSQTAWEVATDALVCSATAPKLHGAKRLLGIAEDGSLAYVEERLVDGELAPRLSAKLDRYAG